MTLTELQARLSSLLDDTAGEIYPDAVLTLCIRQALALLQTVCPVNLSLSGLDGAESSELAGMEALLLFAAQVKALERRLMNRLEAYPIEQREEAGMQDWLQMAARLLEKQLDERRLSFLQQSTASPYALWLEPDEEAA